LWKGVGRGATARWLPTPNKRATAPLPPDEDARQFAPSWQNHRYTRLDITTFGMPQCSTPNAKIVSNKNRQKKFLLKLIFV